MGIASTILATKEAQAKQAGFTIAKLSDYRQLAGTLAGLGATAGAGYLGYEHRADLGRAYGALTSDTYAAPAATAAHEAEMATAGASHATAMQQANDTFHDLSAQVDTAKDSENNAWGQLHTAHELPDRLRANAAMQDYNSQFTPENPMTTAPESGWRGVPVIGDILRANDTAGAAIHRYIP